MIQNKHVISALPLVADILGRKYGVRVFIGGDTACTNGKDIHLPGLPLDSDETALNLARAYIDHEAAHLRDTDFQALQKAKLTPLEHHIWNILEDWRVEQKMASLFPGCRHNFTWLIKHLFCTAKTPGSKKSDSDQATPAANPAVHILNWILLFVRAWDVPEVATERDRTADVVEVHYPGLLPLLTAVLDTVPNRCCSTQDCITVAREIVAVLKRYAISSSERKQGKKHKEHRQQKPAGPTEGQQPGQGLLDMLTSASPGLPKDLGGLLAESLSGISHERGDKLQVAIRTQKQTAPFGPEALADARRATTALRTRLHALLQSTVNVRSRTGYKGRLDTQILHRMFTGNPRIFRQHGEKQGIDTAVHILLDSSGSMSGHAIELAGKACFAVASALHAIPGVSVAVTAFPGDPIHQAGGTINWSTVAPILKHGERMHSEFALTAAGNTPMGEALWWAMQQMQIVNESRRIIMIITDGEPSAKGLAKNAILIAKATGYEVYGIGIGKTGIQELLPVGSMTIHDVAELAPSMFKILSESMLKNREF